jgi:hypothetical protein
MASSASEAGGLVLALAIIDRLGRRHTQAITYFLAAIGKRARSGITRVVVMIRSGCNNNRRGADLVRESGVGRGGGGRGAGVGADAGGRGGAGRGHGVLVLHLGRHTRGRSVSHSPPRCSSPCGPSP